MPRTPLLWLAKRIALLGILGLAVGLVRSFHRFRSGDLPDQYLVESVFVNAGLFCVAGLLAGALALPVLLALRTRRSRARSWLPRALYLSGTAVLFWGLNTAIGFRVMREFFQGATEPVVGELKVWLPGVFCAVCLGLLLSSGRSWRWLGATALVILGALGSMAFFSWQRDPSRAESLTLERSARRHPTVVLILIDTLRADHLSCYGYEHPTSPNLDDLGSQGVIYSRTFAPAPWTRPSTAALLTSRYPPETRLDDVFSVLPASIPILPQYMKEEGYRTAAIAANVQVSEQFGFGKGFDHFDIGTSYLGWTGTKMAWSRLGVVEFSDIYPRYDARQLTGRALSWIADQPPGEPLFLYLHYADPHAPYQPPEKDDRWREFATEAALTVDEPPPTPTWLGRELTPAEVDAMVARYDAEIAFLDQQIVRLFEDLKRRELWDESLVVVTSDHGEEFLEHGGFAHDSSLYNEQIHVPLIVKYPTYLGVEAGQRVDHEASLVDVLPTVREVLDARWPDTLFRGRSLLRDDLGRDRYAVYARAYAQRLRALIRDGDKILQKVDGARESVESERYFSLSEDYGEQGEGEVEGKLAAERLEEMRSLLAALDALEGEDSREITLDEATRKELEALGYLN